MGHRPRLSVVIAVIICVAAIAAVVLYHKVPPAADKAPEVANEIVIVKEQPRRITVKNDSAVGTDVRRSPASIPREREDEASAEEDDAPGPDDVGEAAHVGSPAPERLPSSNDKWAGKEYKIVEVFYATDRKRTGDPEPAGVYGAEISDLELGKLEVSIPKRHQCGNLESPSFLRLEFHEHPEKHIVLLRVSERISEDAWTGGIDDRLAGSRAKAVLLFIHGFDDTFEFAARRAAQLAFDLGLDGVPALFSWPSQGTDHGYLTDEERVEAAVPDLKQVLTLIRKRTKAKSIHIVAHSMGNRVLCNALREFAIEKSDVRVNQVILAAPDIYSRVFNNQLAPEIVKVCGRVSLYASSKDKALILSMKFHNNPRAGLSGADIVVAPGIDTIDASNVDTSLIGHGYFAENRTVIEDIFQVIAHESPPSLRHLVKLGKELAIYWGFP